MTHKGRAGAGQNERRRQKKTDKRKPHHDRYEHQRLDTALRRLAEHHNEERNRD